MISVEHLACILFCCALLMLKIFALYFRECHSLDHICHLGFWSCDADPEVMKALKVVVVVCV